MTKSEQARADAIADAETLWWYCIDCAPTLWAQLDDAMQYVNEFDETAILDAVHAAFNAVPGLRG